eukprot:7158181-Alexandrium_andersonii.AAC.1
MGCEGALAARALTGDSGVEWSNQGGSNPPDPTHGASGAPEALVGGSGGWQPPGGGAGLFLPTGSRPQKHFAKQCRGKKAD